MQPPFFYFVAAGQHCVDIDDSSFNLHCPNGNSLQSYLGKACGRYNRSCAEISLDSTLNEKAHSFSFSMFSVSALNE